MRLMHLSDLHIGKRVNDFSMIEDQRYILREIEKIVDKEKPDGIMIAGDIYDKAVPTAEAVQLFDEFLTELAKRKQNVFLVSGNHDSAERIAYGANILSESNIYISPVFDGKVHCVEMKDQYGVVNIYMLPFLKPAHVRKYMPNEEIETYQDALKAIIDHISLKDEERNVLIAHQFITGAECCDSEELSIGGLDQIDATVFDAFDYVALGHIHGPQMVLRETIRYCGSPLKYSFSEVNHKKSVTMVTLEQKGKYKIDKILLHPRYEMRKIRGKYEELTLRENYRNTQVEDYLHITLEDEEDVLDAMGKLRSIYPNIMKLEYDNVRTRNQIQVESVIGVDQKDPEELVDDFYKLQNGKELSLEQMEYLKECMEHIWEEA